MKNRIEFELFVVKKARELEKVGNEFDLLSITTEFPHKGCCEYVLLDSNNNLLRGIIEYDTYSYN